MNATVAVEPPGDLDAAVRGVMMGRGVRDAASRQVLDAEPPVSGSISRRPAMHPGGLRRREGGTLLLCELPALGRRNYYAGRVGQAVAKRAGYTFHVGHPALQRVKGYRMSTRASAVARARRRGIYDRPPDLRIIQRDSRAGRVHGLLRTHVTATSVDPVAATADAPTHACAPRSAAR
ncbi:hypothetical protein [Streptomyces griseoruber]|uniref:hypothetical protein n=1 Tax=Streptomyces griseoruber TaxID=1943 RepID=UPI0037903B86